VNIDVRCDVLPILVGCCYIIIVILAIPPNILLLINSVSYLHGPFLVTLAASQSLCRFVALFDSGSDLI
jgi:hypothetical protein